MAIKFNNRLRTPSFLTMSPALRISLIYLAFAMLWILLSDRVALELFGDLSGFSYAQTVKGMAFILLTSMLLYILVRAEGQQREAIREESHKGLQALREHFDHLSKFANDSIFLLDASGRIVEANDRAIEVYGYTRESLLNMTAGDLRPLQHSADWQNAVAQAKLPGGIFFETVHHRKNGEEFPVEISSRPISKDGQRFVYSIVRDISARKTLETKLTRTSQLYRALSQCNETMLWCSDEIVFLSQVCRIAVESGGMKMAWIGMVDADGKMLKPVAAFGDGVDYINDLKISIDVESPYGHGPTGMAIRENKAFWCQDYLHDPATQPWHAHGVQYGWHASAAVPIIREGHPAGTLNLYAAEANAFDESERDLLEKLAADISLALARFDAEKLRESLHEQLQARELQLQMFIDNAPAALAMFDSDMRYLSVSRRWLEDYRLGDRNLRGVSHYEVFPEIPERWKSIHQRAMAGEIVRCDEDSFKRADGSIQWLRWAVHPWRDINGQVNGIVIFSEDITQRKYSELQLEESERRWHFAIDGSELGLWDWNVPEGTVFFSERWKTMLGFADDEISNQLTEWSGRVHPDDMPTVMADVDRHFRGETEFYANEHRVRCKDGSYKWIMDRGKVVDFTKEGKPQRMIGTHTDLTVLKDREQTLALNARVFEESAEGIVICGPDKRILSVNRAFTEITGYRAEDAIGQNPRFVKSGRHDANFYRNMWHQIDKTGRWQGEIWNRRKGGEVYPEFLSINAAHDGMGRVTHYFGIFSDITQRKLTEEHINHLAHYDALTDLPNRTLLEDRAQHAIIHAQREKEPLVMMFLDIDRFKNVNDSLGHPIGDKLLIEVAQRLKAHVRDEDTVSRLGGDEFILLLPDTKAEGAAHVASKLIQAISEPFLIERNELSITISIGLAVYPVDGHSFDTLLQCADASMYRAKHDGRNTFRFFAPEMHLHVSRTLQLENGLRHALERQELMLYYQPQMDLESGRIIGCEALLRWKHPEFGMVSPADFIPIAEESGLILPIGEWVLRTAAAQSKAWQSAGLPHLVMAVNLSAVQFRQLHLHELVQQVINENQLEPSLLELELTESITMDNPITAIGIMDRLHNLGIKLSIDDFGTGYSSLSYLKRFSINKLKIDQSFVRDVNRDADNEAIVTAVIRLAASLGLQTIAEGVETQEQLELLRNKGCNEIQGYLIGKPMPANEFEALVRVASDNPL